MVTGSPFEQIRPLVNIDHHGTNDYFGDLNLVDGRSSSTGELVFKVIREAGFFMSQASAENLFVAIMTDTGSFRYNNTTGAALAIAAKLVDQGVKPWEISKRMSRRIPRLSIEVAGEGARDPGVSP